MGMGSIGFCEIHVKPVRRLDMESQVFANIIAGINLGSALQGLGLSPIPPVGTTGPQDAVVATLVPLHPL